MDKMSRQYGASISIVIRGGKKVDEKKRMLELLGFPFERRKK